MCPGGDSWVEPYSLLPPPPHEELLCLFDCKELEFVTGASWILRVSKYIGRDNLGTRTPNRCVKGEGAAWLAAQTALGRGGVTVKDATTPAKWEGDFSIREGHAPRKRIAEGETSDSAAFRAAPCEGGRHSGVLGLEGEGKLNTELFRYVCGLILDGDRRASSASCWLGRGEVSVEERQGNGPLLLAGNSENSIGLSALRGRAIGDSADGGGYSMSRHERALVGFLFGDLESVHAVADCWADSIFAIVNSLHVRVSKNSLIQSCCSQQRRVRLGQALTSRPDGSVGGLFFVACRKSSPRGCSEQCGRARSMGCLQAKLPPLRGLRWLLRWQLPKSPTKNPFSQQRRKALRAERPLTGKNRCPTFYSNSSVDSQQPCVRRSRGGLLNRT